MDALDKRVAPELNAGSSHAAPLSFGTAHFAGFAPAGAFATRLNPDRKVLWATSQGVFVEESDTIYQL